MSSRQKKDWNIDTLLSVIGFVFELMRVVVTALRKRGGGIDHLRRLLKEPALVDKVFDLIVDKATEIVLRAGEYLVNVTYEMPRDKEKLEGEFSKDGVSELFYNVNYTWEKHESYRDDDMPGDEVFLVKHFNRRIESEDAIREMDPQGYRPATHLEAHAFALANPELQRQFWIVALGSSATRGDGRFVAVLSSSSGRRILVRVWFGGEWGSGGRFLFVRK